MTVVGQWRATYTPGDWLVLCGPTSLVVVEPPGQGWTPLVEELWQQVLVSSSLVDLAGRLANYGLDTMPSFGALFWTADGMRSLVRGSVSVVDPASGRVVADGAGIQTWSEVGLDDLSTVLVQTGAPAPSPDDVLRLPLAVGAVQASAVLLDARDQARVHSPQLDAAPDPGPVEHTDEAAPPEVADGLASTELLPDPAGLAGTVGPTTTDPAQQAMESADTELVPLAAELGRPPVPPAPRARPPPGAAGAPVGSDRRGADLPARPPEPAGRSTLQGLRRSGRRPPDPPRGPAGARGAAGD